MTYMLDTNICIFMLRHNEKVIGRFHASMSRGITVSAIVFAELEFGAANSAAQEKNRDALISFATLVQAIDFDGHAAAEYGEIRAHLERSGRQISPLDTLIAAHARSRGLTLVTNNTREFSRVPGLALEDWAT
jgi:tRNA(fMet)-specific endonuclease VapC